VEQDRNFDELGERFARNIYASPKGRIRQAVLWRHLLDTLPELEQKTPQTILDAGCGHGQLAAQLALLGHRLTLCDVSAEMLTAARDFIDSTIEGHADVVTPAYHQVALQDMPARLPQPVDIVLCHAVLEWLADPEAAVAVLADLVRPGGHLSLTFYNRDALIYRNLINGNLRKVKSGDYAGHPGGLTPTQPLAPTTVLSWLEQQGFTVVSTAGLRVFFDYIPRQVRERLPLTDVLELEQQYSRRQPFAWLARYCHVIARCDVA
jgi:S-adenosylmethionine-dependent methyltransferase